MNPQTYNVRNTCSLTYHLLMTSRWETSAIQLTYGFFIKTAFTLAIRWSEFHLRQVLNNVLFNPGSIWDRFYCSGI